MRTIAALTLLVTTPALAGTGRAMVPRDLFAISKIADAAVSPDGKLVAVVIQRPLRPGESAHRGYLNGADRSDVWLVRADGSIRENITQGARTYSGYWQPVWSPEGRYLAMLSSNGGDNVRIYIFDRLHRRLRRLTNGGADMALRVEFGNNRGAPMVWLDSSHLLTGILPAGRRPLAFDEEERTSQIASAGALAAKGGRSSTALVLRSGAADSTQRADVAVTTIDVISGATRLVTRIPLTETRLAQRVLSVSPTKRFAAIMETEPPLGVAPKGQLRIDDLHPLRMGVVALNAQGDIRWIDSVRPLTFGFSERPAPIRWNPSGSAFATVGIRGDSDAGTSPVAFIVAADSGLQVTPGSIIAEDLRWTSDGLLLVYGYAAASRNRENPRRDWWINDPPINLTAGLPTSPRWLFPTSRSNKMMTNSDGRLWTVDLQTHKAYPEENAPTARILWPPSGDSVPSARGEIVVLSPSAFGSASDLYLVSEAWQRLGTLPVGASFREYSTSGGFAIYETLDTRLCSIAPTRTEPVTLISLNRRMDEIAKPLYRNFEYQNSDGKTLTASLLLPYDYSPERSYPMITSVYAGNPAPQGDWASPYNGSYLNPLLLSGHGYAVLVPSMPLTGMGVASDPLLDLDKSVRPAVERAIEMGITKRDRIGVMGVSYGGYSVYGLLAQSSQFKAAVALAGITDLLSYYGTFDRRYRFSDGVIPLLSPYGVESQQMRMGVPPWPDATRYLRNSPLTYADRITTPVLMFHGDMDVVPLAQAEELFVAFKRLNKRAELVRYLGEGHSIESPANILNMWERIFAWFEEFSPKPQPSSSVKPN